MTLSRRTFLHRAGLGSGAAVLQICRFAAAPRLARTIWAAAATAPETARLATSPRLEAQLFGAFAMRRDGRALWERSLRTSRAQKLAALLILNPTGLTSEWLGRLITSAIGGPERTGHWAQVAAYELRKQLGSKAAVRFTSPTYRLNPHLSLTADVREFDAALATARTATGAVLLENLSKVVAVYRAPLLTNWHDPWVEPIRAYYQSRYASAAAQLAELQAVR